MSEVSAAVGDISAVRISGNESFNGWVAEVDISDFVSTSTTNSLGLGANNDPSGAKIVFTVTSNGYTAAGAVTTLTRIIYGTKIVRLPYPNQGSLDIATTSGKVTIKVSLSDYIYGGETATVSMASGWYTDNGPGGTGLSNNAVTDLAVTNSSVLTYPKSVGRWAWPGYERVTGDFLVEAVAFNRFARNGKPIAAMVFSATDEHSNTVYATTTDMTISTRSGDANVVQVYAATIPVASLTQGDVITVNFKAYPWVGTSTAILSSDLVANGGNGFAQPDERLGPIAEVLDKTGAYGISFAVVDPASTGANSTVYATQSAAESAYSGNANTAYITVKAASDAIKTFNNANYSRNEAGGGTILLSAANHEVQGAAPLTMGTMKTWLTITKLSTITEAQAVINANTSNRQWNTERIKLKDITISSASSLLLYGNTASTVLWLDSNTINISAGSGGIVGWKLSYATHNTISSFPIGFSHNGVTKNPYALIRGNSVTSGYIPAQLYNVLGNSNISPSVVYLTGNAQGQQITTNAIAAFNTLYNLNAAYSPVGVFLANPSTTNTEDIAIIQNIFENRITTSPLIALAAQTQQVSSSSNILTWYNTVAGARFNNAYNGYGSVPIPHTLYHEIGNLFDNWNQHANDYDATFDTANGGRIGGWAIEYAVGLIGNMMRTSSVSSSFFHGINTNYGGTLGYVSDKSATGDAAGNGNYHLTSGSSARDLVPSGSSVLPYDLDGNPRRNDGTGAAGAYEYVIAPSVTTSAPTLVSTSTLTLNGSITATGGADATQSGFAYGTVADLSTVIATTTLGAQTGTASFSQGLTGLTPSTMYYFRAYAVNSAGTSTGAILSTTTLTHIASTYTFSGPSSGNAGSASTNFTVTPNGLYTGTITLTPSGSGSTGLSATVLTFSDSSAAQTFTITPTVSGSITLTPTNSGSLSNPSNLAYTVNAVVPGSPTSVSAATSTPNQATVTYSAPAFNGGSSILYYLASSTPGNFTGISNTADPITVTGLTNGTSYTFVVYAVNATGTSTPSSASSAVIPIGVPGAPTSVTATAGNTQAAINFSAPASTGGSPITGYTVTSSPSGGTDTNAGSTALTHTVTGLTNGTAYTFTVTATNIVGTGSASSASNSITPSTVSAVSTNVTTNIARTTATLNGQITSTGGADATESGFAYGTVANLSTVIATTTLGAQTSTASFLSNISSLSANTTYYVRAYAVNVSGTTTGSIISFLTLPVVPTVTTQAPTAGSGIFFTANGNITATGGVNATTRGFAYGLTTAYGATTTETSSFGTGAYTATISGLACDTLYHVKPYAINTGGTGFGSDQTITTGECTKPTMTAEDASDITTTSATLNGIMTADGNASSTVRGFNWGNDVSYGQIASTDGTYGTGSFTQTLSGLVCNTTYHFQAFATNAAGQGTSTDQSLTTSACPVATASTNSSGSSVSSRIYNLLSMGLTSVAQSVAKQYGLTIPKQINTPVTPNTPSTGGGTFTRPLSIGTTHSDVKRLQIYLNAQGFTISKTGAGSPGKETNYFGQLTKSALMKYQLAHKEYTLDPQGLKAPTGFFGMDTRKAVNEGR